MKDEGEALLAKLTEHLKLEEDEVESYLQSLNQATNTVAAILYRGFLNDAKRHVQILRTIIAYLKSQEEGKSFASQIREMEGLRVPRQVEALLKEEKRMIDDPFINLLLESISLDELKRVELESSLAEILKSTRMKK